MNLHETIFRVLDCETTGLDPKVDRICQVGWTDVIYTGVWVVGSVAREALCNPGIPIPATASAIHHLTDRMVVDCPSPISAINLATAGVGLSYAAHNEEFDRGFISAALGGNFVPWLCTMRLAKHLYPDAPSYSNQALRYWLGYEEIPHVGVLRYAHSAGFDAQCTAAILAHMLNYIEAVGAINMAIADVQALIDFAQSPVILQGKLGFGKWHDKTWAEVPRDYLEWMAREDMKARRDTGSPAWDVDQNATIDFHLRHR